jgi:hypothetical protein
VFHGPGEQDYETLDDDDHVAADVGHCEGDFRAALIEHAEQDCGQHDAERMRAAHQRHGDADEAGAGHEIELHAPLRAHDGVQRHQAGQRARDQHGDDDDPSFLDAGVARSLGAETHGADLVAELGAPDQRPDAHRRDEGQQEGYVEGRAAHRKAERLHEPGHGGDVRARPEGPRLGRHGARRLEHVDQHVDHDGCGDEVEHDRRDDDVAAASRLQPGGDQRPGRSDRRRGDDGDGVGQPPGQDMVEGQRDDGDSEAGDEGLAFPADVEQAAMERDRDREAGEDEVRRIVERVADAGA